MSDYEWSFGVRRYLEQTAAHKDSYNEAVKAQERMYALRTRRAINHIKWRRRLCVWLVRHSMSFAARWIDPEYCERIQLAAVESYRMGLAVKDAARVGQEDKEGGL